MRLPLPPWPSAPPGLVLVNDEVHIWRAELDVISEIGRSLAETLSPEEQLRSSRFIFPRDRDRFVACRGMLRKIIARYLCCDPGELRFNYGAYGKPELQQLKQESSLKFNVSHSHGLAVYALSGQRELGIDTELIQPTLDYEEVAKHSFSAAEISELLRIQSTLRPRAFFLGWTRKEAYIKALGSGLQTPLDGFSVSLTPGEPEQLTSTDSARWKLVCFEPAPEFVGALAAEGHDWQPRYWSCNPTDLGL